MTGAALIYLATASLVFGLDVLGLVASGPNLGTILFALVGVSFLVQAHSLFRRTSSARPIAIFCSGGLVVAFAYVAIDPFIGRGLAGAAEVLRVFLDLVVVASFIVVLHSAALALLLLRPARPNYSLKRTAASRHGVD
jgi:hypothetical protein